MDAWIQREIEACTFPDLRLKRRLGKLIQNLSDRVGDTLPTACRDWAATKAAYRFFDHPRVNEGVVLAGHFAATAARFAESEGLALVLHDTMEASFQRAKPQKIGYTTTTPSPHATLGQAKPAKPAKPAKVAPRKPLPRTICGMRMHSALVLDADGRPLGLAAAKFLTRKAFKGTNALKRKVNPTRVPIHKKESHRWLQNVRDATQLLGDPGRLVHVGDREADIYELFCEAAGLGTHFLIRTAHDRLAGERGATTRVSKKLARSPVRGMHTVRFRNGRGRPQEAELRVRFQRMTVHPSVAKKKRYPPLELTVIHAPESRKPAGRDRIHWKLVTDLEVQTLDQAVQKLDWYADRWKIETFHKVLKSGCGIEQRRLETADRLVNLLSVYCVVAWRVFSLTTLQRARPQMPADMVLTPLEIRILAAVDGLAEDAPARPLGEQLRSIARLGGYLDRKNDGPRGTW